MTICQVCGKPLSSSDGTAGISEHEACEELAEFDAEQERQHRELMARRQTNGLSGIIGQQDVVERLRQFAALYEEQPSGCLLRRSSDGARRYLRRPGHVLLTGPSGIGKRTLARAFAHEYCEKDMEVDAKSLTGIREVSAMLRPVIMLDDHPAALIIANVEQMPHSTTGNIVSYLKDFRADILDVGQDNSSRVMHYICARTTCIATTSSKLNCPPELVEAFPLVLPMLGYSHDELAEIGQLLAERSKLSLTPAAKALVARTSDGTPHQLELLVKRLAALGKSAMEEGEVAGALSAFGHSAEAVHPAGGLPNFETLSGIAFERLITRLLHQMGFEAVMTKASGDGGIDIVATLYQPVVGGRYLVQCKRFAAGNYVGAATVREFYGAVIADRQAVKGVLITTSDFTNQAREFARQLPIELIGGTQLTKLLSECGLVAGSASTFRLFS